MQINSLFVTIYFHIIGCAQRYNKAAVELERFVKPEVREILSETVQQVIAAIPDVLLGNLKAVAEKLKTYGYDGFGRAAALSSNNRVLRNLFKRLQASDKDALDDIAKLKNGDRKGLLSIICKLFNAKAKLIGDFIAKQKK